MIAIVDHGYANVRSVDRMLRWLNHIPLITSSAHDISRADRIILPGIGAFDAPVKRVRELGLEDVLNEQVLVKKRPILGICVGMQMMTNGSQEGSEKGLGWIDGECRRFQPAPDEHLRVPHMGWNKVEFSSDHGLFADLGSEAKFYFAHSYYVSVADQAQQVATCRYSTEFCASFQKDNIFGVQFHPEKSHRFGLGLMKAFMDI